MPLRSQIIVRGIVQGVGFRPFIYTLARYHWLKGRVFNDAGGVVIDVEGEGQAIARFFLEIKQHPPPLSVIESIDCRAGLPPAGYVDFRIMDSHPEGLKTVPVSPDMATCDECVKELFSPSNRRFHYPFINCTNCGPRFTIVTDVPYDRQSTTMRDFAMCRLCRAEYENPLNRRFHAEPIACPKCGPRLYLSTSGGADLRHDPAEDLLVAAQRLVRQGQILAVKGLGGFHLVCDALNPEAVTRLRQSKYRAEKPFALMAASLQPIKEFCQVSLEEETLLRSVHRPIVLLSKKPDAGLPGAIAPGVGTFGFMLPYTPLHHLLLENLAGPLVMTSGNVSDEPICYEDQDALRRLSGIADAFLWHDRRINMRMDDSVVRVQGGRDRMLRRSRGYAPAPLRLGFKAKKQILACGAELKNVFCFLRDQSAYLSHHIGDLENLETLESFTQGINHFKSLFGLRPEVVAYDLHPEYLSTKYAAELPDVAVKIGIQHHHAHIASCLADNSAEGAIIGVALDGLGFGTDGRLWGGEFLVADFSTAERVGHLAAIPMPGGTKAIREPWRMAAIYLFQTFGEDFLKVKLPFVAGLNQPTWHTLRQMVATGTNCPETSSMGRLFDAVAALVGLRNSVSYEGQAAMELETLADGNRGAGYQFEIEESGVIRTEPVIRKLAEDLLNGQPAAAVSARFHSGVAQLIQEMAVRLRHRFQLHRVALSGGVFQNWRLLAETTRRLAEAGFEVLTHSRVPANDGGIALGQAAIANALLAAGRK